MHLIASIKDIQKANSAVYEAFETLNFKEAALHLTPDCDYITFNGEHVKGRDAYIQMHEELMNNFMFRGAKLEGQIKDIRFLSDSSAIVIATGAIRFRWQKKAPQKRQSINTTVWVKNKENQWQITSFHNCRIKELGAFARWMMKLGKK